MLDGTGLHSVNHLVRSRQNRISTKAGHNLVAAVDTGRVLILSKTTQLQRLADHRSEVLVRTDMGHTGISHNFSGKHTVSIAFLWRHQAVGGKQDRRRQIREFLLLILPCGTEVALQVRILLQFRVGVGRQHLTVSIDIDPLALGLLQQQLQIVQIVAGDHNEGPLLHSQGNFNRLGVTKSFGIGLIQQLHAPQVDLTNFQHNGKQLIHAPIVLSDGKHCLVQELMYLIILITQHSCMIGIGSYTADTEEDQGLQAADILISLPELVHIIFVVSAAGGGTAVAPGYQLLFLLLYSANQFEDGIIVKTNIGQRGEQAFHDHPSGGRAHNILVTLGRSGKANEGTSKLILQLGSIRLLTADACRSSTTGAAYSLLTLKTKHNRFSLFYDLSIKSDGYDIKRNVLSAVFDRGFHCVAQDAAAGHDHPGNSNGVDIVMQKDLRQLLRIIHLIQLGTADHSYFAPHEIMVEIPVGIGGTVGSDQQVRTVKVRRVGRQQLDLHRECGQFTGNIDIFPAILAADALTGRTGTAAGQRLCLRCLGFLCRQDSLFVVSRSFPLLKRDGIHRTGGQTVTQTVAVVFPQELGLAAHHSDGSLVTSIGTQAAAVALLFIDFNDFPNHSLPPYLWPVSQRNFSE